MTGFRLALGGGVHHPPARQPQLLTQTIGRIEACNHQSSGGGIGQHRIGVDGGGLHQMLHWPTGGRIEHMGIAFTVPDAVAVVLA